MSFDLIISCATFKERLINDCYLHCIKNLLSFKLDFKIHYILNIYKNDVEYFSKDLKNIIKENNIEVILCDKNLKSHNKYYYCMQKYKDVPIMTIDDDCVYQDHHIRDLYIFYKRDRSKVVCNCSKKICKKPYKDWIKNRNFSIGSNILPIGCGGILYPPDILKISINDLDEIVNDYLDVDDIFLKSKENKYNILCCTFGKQYPKESIESRNTPKLYIKNLFGGNNDYVFNKTNFFNCEKNP